jgi:hypothetical protein
MHGGRWTIQSTDVGRALAVLSKMSAALHGDEVASQAPTDL